MNKPIKIWAHRGASGYEPENTIQSFLKAVELGADGIELDIQLTKDNEIVICHDETIDRTSDGTGWIKDFTLQELKQFNFNCMNSNEKMEIPTMEEVFSCIKDTNALINIELKTGIVFYEGIVDQILDMTHAFGMEDRVIYSSFNHYTMTELKQKKEDAYTAFLYQDGPIGMPEYARKYHMNAIHPALYNLQFPHLVSDAHELGLEVNVWSANTEEYLLLCKQMEVDGIFTNYPDLARKVL